MKKRLIAVLGTAIFFFHFSTAWAADTETRIESCSTLIGTEYTPCDRIITEVPHEKISVAALRATLDDQQIVLMANALDRAVKHGLVGLTSNERAITSIFPPRVQFYKATLVYANETFNTTDTSEFRLAYDILAMMFIILFSAIASGVVSRSSYPFHPASVGIVVGVCVGIVVGTYFGSMAGVLSAAAVAALSAVVTGGKLTALGGVFAGTITGLLAGTSTHPPVFIEWFSFCIFAVLLELVVSWAMSRYREEQVVVK